MCTPRPAPAAGLGLAAAATALFLPAQGSRRWRSSSMCGPTAPSRRLNAAAACDLPRVSGTRKQSGGLFSRRTERPHAWRRQTRSPLCLSQWRINGSPGASSTSASTGNHGKSGPPRSPPATAATPHAARTARPDPARPGDRQRHRRRRLRHPQMPQRHCGPRGRGARDCARTNGASMARTRPVRTPNPGNPTPPARSPATKSCGHRSASEGPSGDDGAGITAEAASKQRCIA